jgi:hypothetical protein
MAEPSNVEEVTRLPSRKDHPQVTLALQRMTDELRGLCPAHVVIAFRFDGRLHVDIDLRTLEEVALVEHLLPTALGGILVNIRRGKAALSFSHRITADVDS